MSGLGGDSTGPRPPRAAAEASDTVAELRPRHFENEKTVDGLKSDLLRRPVSLATFRC